MHNAAMPIIVDGNNLLHRLPTTSRPRAEVRRLVLETTRHERIAIVVVFDGPPPTGSPSEESLGSVTVVYAGKAVADDVMIGRLPTGRAASQWAVVTDDRGLAERARGRGARSAVFPTSNAALTDAKTSHQGAKTLVSRGAGVGGLLLVNSGNDE